MSFTKSPRLNEIRRREQQADAGKVAGWIFIVIAGSMFAVAFGVMLAVKGSG